MAEAVADEMLAGFGESSYPSYRGDNIDALIAANNGRAFGAAKAINERRDDVRR